MATQMDVAKRASVSYMTVSRVVNNLPNVKKETRERVLQAIRELSYYPNAAARILSGRRTNNVGIIFPQEEYIVTRPYFIELSVKLEQRLSESGYHLFLGAIRKGSEDPGLHQLIAEKKVDGLIIFAPSVNDPNVSMLDTEKVPFVVIHGRSDKPDCSFVDTDSVSGTNLVLSHLAELDHRRIGFVSGGLKEINARERLATYRRFLETCGTPYDPDLVFEGDWSLESGYDAFVALRSLRDRPTAILFSNDQMALGGIKAAHDRSIAIPEEVSVAGYDDIKYASFITPSLTTVRQPTDEIARISVELILQSIMNGNPRQQVVLQPELVIRSSTGRRRAGTSSDG